jgi:GNAT superfamily N-acetyltransferase
MKIREMDIEFYRNFYSKNKKKVRAKKSRKEKIVIRFFKPSEADLVQRLIYRTIDVCYSGVYDAESIKHFKEHHSEQCILQDAERGHTIVLFRNRKVIGTGTFLYNTFKRVFIEPQMQRHGFGKTIMQRLELYALNDDVRSVKLHASLPSKPFYESLGYEIVEETYLQVDNHKKLHYYKMKKELKQTLRMRQWISLWIR